MELSLDDLMRGQSAVLLGSVRGEIHPDKFVEVSLRLAQRYIDLYGQEHGGRVDINEIITNIRQYECNARSEHLLDKHEIKKMDKQRHLGLSRWYNEFFVKYYILTQMEDMQFYLKDLNHVIESIDIGELSETVRIFNEIIMQSGIKYAESYMLETPNQDALRYHQEAPQKYKKRQLVEYW